MGIWFNKCNFLVERRNHETLLPIIQREVQAGSTSHADKWPAYSTLNQLDYIHQTVNHQEDYVDPVSLVHAQRIEKLWLDAKIQILKKMQKVPLQHLQSHLDYFSWKKTKKK
ncbi:hypothetical protein ILUMI_07163 [Ignelater luminosus]|uniref:ISXO2-like transposase domain-containing protein n=1 Tax=Ignelater luminosus TaxID=2038154 RepID=A0A8K0D8L7_IGNLU|nr:hypothetical protein ILUMI_07163 [Ignelater luminosus]